MIATLPILGNGFHRQAAILTPRVLYGSPWKRTGPKRYESRAGIVERMGQGWHFFPADCNVSAGWSETLRGAKLIAKLLPADSADLSTDLFK